MRFGSVCSGIEAASVAWQPLGWQAAWFSEIEPFPSAVLAHHYPTVPNLGSMVTLPERILAGEVEAPDLLCGGTPCQAFSVAGLRRSLDDARGNLSLTFCELADAIDTVRSARGQQPAIVFWENVPGVLSTADNAFGCFLGRLVGAGCELQPPRGKWSDAGCVLGPARAVAWRILDAQYFGVAQRRRRVFVVASARAGFDPAAVLFESEGVRRDSAPSREARQDATASAASGAGVQPYQVANCLTQRMHKGINTTLDEGQTPILVPNPNWSAPAWAPCECCDDYWCSLHELHTADCDCPPLEEWTADPYGRQEQGPAAVIHLTLDEVPTPVLAHAFDARQSSVLQCDKTGPLDTDGHSVAVMTPYVKATNPHSADEAPRFELAYVAACLNGWDERHDPPKHLLAGGMAVRRLTPRECERLQGFPDDYTAIPWKKKPAEDCPDGPRYKALGNSWAVPVVRWIGQRISKALTKPDDRKSNAGA